MKLIVRALLCMLTACVAVLSGIMATAIAATTTTYTYDALGRLRAVNRAGFFGDCFA
jgi:hypothetical protein